jgi:hypothetical protein
MKAAQCSSSGHRDKTLRAPRIHQSELVFVGTVVAIALTLMLAVALAQEVSVLHFDWSMPGTDGLPDGWRQLTFRNIPRHTRYSIVDDAGSAVVKAVAEASASGLIHPVSVDPRRVPMLRWRWKVENILSKGDVTRKAGDDFAARIYVAFAYDPRRAGLLQRIEFNAIRLIYGEYPPHASLNYVWGNKAPVGTVVPNAFTKRVRMIVVDSGVTGLGQWVEHERNVYEDYKKAFGEEPPMISGIAIMTDADNTGEAATAYYGDISLSSQ